MTALALIAGGALGYWLGRRRQRKINQRVMDECHRVYLECHRLIDVCRECERRNGCDMATQ